MGKGKDRNRPCWCGSGVKYKRCHLQRKGEKPEKWEVEGVLKQSFSKKICLAPEILQANCRGSIVRAHVISKTSNLKYIARNGHVYSLKPSFSTFDDTGGLVKPELLGINKAATFTGFCSHHDKDLFSPIEDQQFIAENQQIFLMGYRAICRELYVKQASNVAFEKVQQEYAPNFPDDIDAYLLGTRQAIKDLVKIKAKYDDDLLCDSYDDYWYLTVELSEPLPIVCSGVFAPALDFEANNLQDSANLNVPLTEVTFNSVISDGQGYVVMSGRKDEANIVYKFISTFIAVPENLKVSTFIDMACRNCETICVSPTWWDAISHQEQEKLQRKMNDGINPYTPLQNDSLISKAPYTLLHRPVCIITNVG